MPSSSATLCVFIVSALVVLSHAQFREIRNEQEAFQYAAKKRYVDPNANVNLKQYLTQNSMLQRLLDSTYSISMEDMVLPGVFPSNEIENNTVIPTNSTPTTTQPNSTWYDIVTIIDNITTATASPPSQCLADLITFGMDITTFKPYALMMVDSYGKLPPGILQGNVLWLGLFDQCLSQTKEKTQTEFGAQYCLASGTYNTTTLTVGICVPDSCSNEDLYVIFNSGLLANSTIVTASCNKTPEYTGGAIACLILFSILGLFIVAGTSYEFFTIYFKRPDDPLGFLTLVEEPVDNNGSIQTHPSASPNRLHMMNTEENQKPYDSPSSAAASLLPLSSIHHQPSDDNNASEFIVKLLLCFSIITNGGKILKTTQGQASLSALNGIRVLSLWWVILGHTYFFPLTLFSNPTQIYTVLSRFSFQAIGNATFSVDSFFFLSGLLVTYLTLKYIHNNDGKLNWAMYYIHRYIRLTPVYMLIIFAFTTLTPHFAVGPLYSSVFDQSPPPNAPTALTYCQQYWWTNLLYINNLYPESLLEECLGWSWYLANDMQFYIISPFVIYLLYHHLYAGIAVWCTLLGICLSSIIGLTIAHDIVATPFPLTPQENFLGEDVYTKPWTRISPYLVGMALGYILFRYNGRIRMPRFVAILGWLAATIIGLSVVYGLYGTYHGHELSRTGSVFYITLCRFAWAIALAWVSFACCTGYGGPVNTLLSWSFWIPLSRINYCAYLLHPIIMMVFQYSLPTQIYFSDFLLVYFFLANIVMSYATAFVVSVCAEAPFMALEKLLLRRDKSV